MSSVNIGELKAKRDVQSLIIALGERDLETRLAAAAALGEIGDVQAIAPLIEAIRKTLPQDAYATRKVVAKALSLIGTPIIEPLIKSLLDETNSYVVAGAAEALGYLKNPDAIQPLIKALELATYKRIGDQWEVTNGCIAAALASIGKAVIPSLLIAIEDEYPVCLGAIRAFIELRSPEALEPLVVKLKHEFWIVRQSSAMALGEIGDKRATESLIEALKKDDNSLVRSDAARALGEIGDIRAKIPLQTAMEDTDGSVRSNAADALKKLEK